MTELTLFRAEVDDFFQFHPQSPLDDAQREAFEGLKYFTTNEVLKMEVDVERFPDLGVGGAGRGLFQHLDLAVGETGRVVG